MPKLYDIEKGAKIYEECSDGSKYFVFVHLDGMYSYCKTQKGGVVHLAATAPLVAYEDGYKVKIEEDKNKNDDKSVAKTESAPKSE